MPRKIFITGTDTNVGKTYIAAGFIRKLNQHNIPTLGIKPVASGCELTENGLRNADALLLQSAGYKELDYIAVNPIALQPAIAPHIAAEQAGIELSVNKLLEVCQPTFMQAAEIIIIEGAGGWLVPLNTKETLADFVTALDLEVIFVVGMRLGCINHALLMWQVLQKNQVKVLGWIANFIDPEMHAARENLATLKTFISAPCLGEIHFQTKPEDGLSIVWAEN
jgi:dethiobiotin synthetase